MFSRGITGLLSLALLVSAGESQGVARAWVEESCRSSNPRQICLGLKYVAYRRPDGSPVVTRAEALANVRRANQVFARCGVAFQIDRYLVVDPIVADLRFRTASLPELDAIRGAFEEPDKLLVVTTGPWDRRGNLGATEANAWTAMPGTGLYGAVLEASVGTYSNLLAHELGHYMNLEHLNDPDDLMNGITYRRSQALYESQCATVRAAAAAYWRPMYR